MNMNFENSCICCERKLNDATEKHRYTNSKCTKIHELSVINIDDQFKVCSCCWEIYDRLMREIHESNGTQDQKTFFMKQFFRLHYDYFLNRDQLSTCAICLEHLWPSAAVTLFPCVHQVCYSCKEYGLSVTRCFMCRQKVTTRICPSRLVQKSSQTNV